MDDRERSCVFHVQNTGAEPVEATITLAFGYPASDSLGDVHLELLDDPPPDAPSAVPWVRALPRMMRLAPGEQQAVRVLASPPGRLAPGEYWGRVIVAGANAAAPRALDERPDIAVGITLETRIVISLSYRHAPVSTGVKLSDFRARLANGVLQADIDLKREGNAAYLGRVQLTLRDQAGRIVHDSARVIAVYYDLHRRYTIPLPALAAGRYRLHLLLSTSRTDLPAAAILPAESVEEIVDLEIS